jgi:hypothetical protein
VVQGCSSAGRHALAILRHTPHSSTAPLLDDAHGIRQRDLVARRVEVAQGRYLISIRSKEGVGDDESQLVICFHRPVLLQALLPQEEDGGVDLAVCEHEADDHHTEHLCSQ